MHRILVALLLLVAPIAGCSGGTTGATEPPDSDVVLRIVVGGEVAADWTLAELEARVSFTELEVDGDTQSGPLLNDVLAESGVGSWETAEVFGSGEGRVFEVALPIDATEVDDTWIFDVTNRGTLKLAAKNLPREQWVRDVGEIVFP